MLIIALVLALVGLVALVFAIVTSNELVAWVCIGASALGVVLLISDALRERQRRASGSTHDDLEADYPEDAEDAEEAKGVGEAKDVKDAEDIPAEDNQDAEVAASDKAGGGDNAGS